MYVTFDIVSLFADGSKTVINKEKYACLQFRDSLIYAMRRHRTRIQVFTYREGRVRRLKVISLPVQPKGPKRSFAVTNECLFFIGADGTTHFVSKDNGALVDKPQPEVRFAGDACMDNAGIVLCGSGADKLYELQHHDIVIPVEFSALQQETIFGAGKLNGKLFVGSGKTLTMFTSAESQASRRQKQKSTAQRYTNGRNTHLQCQHISIIQFAYL